VFTKDPKRTFDVLLTAPQYADDDQRWTISSNQSIALLASELVPAMQSIVQPAVVASLSLIEMAVNKITGIRNKIKITCLFVGGEFNSSFSSR
jgi:hypothetical protein